MLVARTRPYQRQSRLNLKIYSAIDEYETPLKFIVTGRIRADCNKAINLLKNIDAELLFAARAYDAHEILSDIAQ